MKRLAWLVILVFGTALAQVSPLDLGNRHHKVCSCCETPGDCGAPGCQLPAACASTNLVSDSPARAAVETSGQKAEATATVAVYSHRDAGSLQLACPSGSPEIVCVPLFKVHCSFVI